MTATEDEDGLARWKENVANGSQVYANVSSRRLRAFCKDAKTTAKSVGEMDVSELRRLLEDYLVREKRRGHSGGYIGTTIKAVRSWRIYNGKPVVEGLKLPNTALSPRVDSEAMPTPEDLRRVLLAAKPGERVSISLMAFGGVRPQVIGTFDGTDGLTVGDLPELKVSGESVSFEKTPTIVRVRAKNNKTRNAYFTFVGEEGCLSIKQYLEQRIIGGETIDSGSDLVHPERSRKKFVTTTNVGDGVRRAMRAAGLDQRPYVWRAYFLSRLLEAQNAGKITDRYAEFFAGHTGDVTAKHYTTGRVNLSKSMVEDMRAAYRRCEPYLSTVPTVDEKEERELLVKAAILRMFGSSQEEAEKLAADPDVDVRKLIRERLGVAAGVIDPKILTPKRNGEQRVVEADATGDYLEAGWTFKSPLNGTKAVVEWSRPVS